MNSYKRSGNRWTINEVLSLQREYELLEWNVTQIAEKHQRSVEAILFKLEAEGFIASWNEARGYDFIQYPAEEVEEEEDEDEDISVVDCCEDSEYVDECCNMSDDEESEVDKLTERVWNLETNVSEISNMVKQMFDKMVSKKSPKRAQLRKY